MSIEHQDTVAFLTGLLRGFVWRKSLGGKVVNGPGVLRPRRDLCREPDILFVSAERLGGVSAAQ